MLYFVVDKDGSEWVYDDPPMRDFENEMWVSRNDDVNVIRLPLGSIKKFCGWETSWEGGMITKENELDYQ